jgi:cytoskeletal protein CcmA (bactofilin family)
MAASTVTGNTSVILVSSPQSKVFLSSVGYPGHIVTIKDVGGLASQGDPIVISTTNGIFFADGSISTLLVDPFSYLTVASKSATSWQILNNIGYLTTLSNAFVDTLTAGNAYTQVTSSIQDSVSTSVAQTVSVTESLTLLGNVDILGNITINGTVDLFSTLNVKEDIRLSSGLLVQGAVSLQSTLALREELIVGGSMSTLNDVNVGENMYIASSLYVQATLVPKILEIDTVTMNTLNLAAGIFTYEGMSVGCNVFLGTSLSTLSSLLVLSSIMILGNTRIDATGTIENHVTTGSFESLSSGVVFKEAMGNSLEVGEILSTPNSLFVGETLTVQDQTNVESVVVTGQVTTNSLIVNGNAEISSIQAEGDVNVLGSVSLTETLLTSSLTAGATTVGNNLQVLNVTSVNGSFSTLGDLFVEEGITVGTTMTVKQDVYATLMVGLSTIVDGTVSTNTIHVNNDLFVNGNFTIPGTATLNALGAPIEIRLSTLTLSNILTVTNSATIPIFTSASNTTFPNSTEVGTDTGFSGFLKADTANIRGTLQDYNTQGDRKAISTTRISTLTGVNLLSTFRVGSSNLTTPLLDVSGILLFGSNIGGSNVYTLTPLDFSVKLQTLQFSTIAYGGSYSPSNSLWVTVGQNSNQSGTIQYSTDKTRTWQPAVSGGFSPAGPFVPPASQAAIGRDIIYMSTTYQNATAPVWVATGRGITTMMGTAASIQYSTDGSNWNNVSGTTFPVLSAGNQGGNRLCLHRFNNSADGAILLAGGGGTGLGIANFGILYSLDGTVWNQANPTGAISLFNCTDITQGASRNLYAVGTLSVMGPASQGLLTAQECNYASGWSNISSNLGPGITAGLTTFNTIAYGNNMYVIGGIPTGGNPLNSIFYSPTLGNWQPIASNGFSGGVQRIVFNDFYGIFLAVGLHSNDQNLQFSPNGTVWQPIPNITFPSPLYNLALGDGQISIPDPVSRFFTVNVESRFETGVSSLFLTASTIAASSFTAQVYSGSAAQISNLTNFGSNMNVSSILTKNFYYGSTLYYAGSTNMNTLSTNFDTLIAGNFLSTVKQTIATGLDSLPNGNIQVTANGIDWVRASNTNFQYYTSEVTGNSNNPALFVATGADSQPNKSIQYSTDGYTWNPVASGGFTINDTDGYKSGNTIATLYSPSIIGNGPRYLVGGNALGSQSTIFYSDDGSNFVSASNSPALLNSISKLKSENTFALALNSSNYIINSSNGIEWNQTNSSNQFSAFAFGFTPFIGTGWVALDSLGGYYVSFNNGSNWNLVIANTFVYDAFDMIYASNIGLDQFYALSSNALYARSSNIPYNWTQVLSPFAVGATSFTSLYWSQIDLKWFLGAEAQNPLNTIFTASLTGHSFSPITTGGFSSGTVSVGAGYAVAISSSLVLVAGSGAFTSLTPTKAQILQASGVTFPPVPVRSTTTVFSQENASNVFSTSIYGLAIGPTTETYPYVAVGDGIVPQKTIARSSNLVDWIPAITGGFSPAGYGLTYYENSNTGSNLWIAVGKAVASTATIQYSEDGTNWFPTNNTDGIPFGGRAVAQISSLGRLVVVGEGTLNLLEDKRTILYSDDGYTWSTIPGVFNVAGYGIAEGYLSFFGSNGLVAVGAPIGGDGSILPGNAIEQSTDGLSWSTGLNGGFTIAGRGIAYGLDGSNMHKWVAVGENTPGSTESNIQYSLDGVSWNNANSIPSEFAAGYGVAFNNETRMFVATGRSACNTDTVLYSHDGASWIALTNSNSGFRGQQSFGTAYGFYSQEVTNAERFPFIEFPKFIVYERPTSFNYGVPSLRVQSTLATFNETLSVNLSSQVMINTFTPESGFAVTVNGDVVTSTLVFKGSEPSYKDIQVSSLIVSTLQVDEFLGGQTLTTPSLGIHRTDFANTLGTLENGNSELMTSVNETLFTRRILAELEFNGGVGINTSEPLLEFQVVGVVTTSSLTTNVYGQDGEMNLQTPNQVFLNSSNLAMFTGADPQLVTGKNTIYSEVSSLTFNNCLTMNLSSQRVGVYTTNPQFDFDARTAGWLESVTTQTVNAGSLFFTLQSL